MKVPPEFSQQPQAAGEGVLVAAWIAWFFFAGLAVNWLAAASAAAGLQLFD